MSYAVTCRIGSKDLMRVLREVLQVREKERRLEVTPPVACARPIEAAARDDGDKATDPYDDIGDDVDLGAGDAE